MRANDSLLPGLAVVATSVALIATVFIAPEFAFAGEAATAPPSQLMMPDDGEAADSTAQGPAAPSCGCPSADTKPTKPKFAGLTAGPSSALDESDEVAALASLQVALTSVGDGSAYVWARSNGRLSGLVRPVSSFRNGDGQICRHVVVMLTTGLDTRKAESTACRLPGGRWQIGG